MNSKISIIIPTYNSEMTISDCLKSIFEQNYTNFEVIVIDKFSSDKTFSILKKFRSKYKDKLLIRQVNDLNHYDAMNIGINLCNGDWIYILGSDDTLADKNVFNDFVNFTTYSEKSLIIYGRVNLIKNNSLVNTIGKKWSISKFFIKSYMSIPHQGVFHDKILFSKYGYFDHKFKFTGDYDLLLRYLKNNKPIYFDRIIANYSLHGGSYKKSNYKSVLFEWRAAQVKNKIFLPRFFWLYAFSKYFIKKIFNN